MKIYIWGTGRIAKRYLDTKEIAISDIMGFIETKPNSNQFMGKPVLSPSMIIGEEYDWIIVCAYGIGIDVYELAKKLGLDISKIIFVDNWAWRDGTSFRKTWPDCLCVPISDKQDNRKIKELFPGLYEQFIRDCDSIAQRFIPIIRNGHDLVEKDDLLQSDLFIDRIYKEDYTRFRCFELMANEIIANEIAGAVAELGVFRGTFSRLINCKFSKKKLYLFDTFTSFDETEFQNEVGLGRWESYRYQMFENTSVEYVMESMIFPENIEIRQGFFPESLNGMGEETYCFVSIDVDLEKSILEGLRYFYPRLNPGGAIFLHDYNNRFLEGVKVAVKKYEIEINQRLNKVPISDEGGTLIICK